MSRGEISGRMGNTEWGENFSFYGDDVNVLASLCETTPLFASQTRRVIIISVGANEAPVFWRPPDRPPSPHPRYKPSTRGRGARCVTAGK